MTTPTFTEVDAQNLIQAAQNSPLRNLKEAEYLSGLLQRFAAWHAHVTKAEVPKPLRKARQESPASPPADPSA